MWDSDGIERKGTEVSKMRIRGEHMKYEDVGVSLLVSGVVAFPVISLWTDYKVAAAISWAMISIALGFIATGGDSNGDM